MIKYTASALLFLMTASHAAEDGTNNAYKYLDYTTLVKDAELVIIGQAIASRDTAKRIELSDPHKKQICEITDTSFSINAVIKGRTSNTTLVVRHYTLPKDADTFCWHGPQLAEFTLPWVNTNNAPIFASSDPIPEYLLFLKSTDTTYFVPVSGQHYSAFSVKDVYGYGNRPGEDTEDFMQTPPGAFGHDRDLFLKLSADAHPTPTNRLAKWALPLDLNGVPNFFQVTTNLYRSAQPTAEGMQNLKTNGIETIINLRSFNSDRDEIGTTGLAYEHIYMKAWHPEREEIIRFLQIVTNPRRTPILVHCKHGSDRTGTMCAIYRIAVQGWSKEDAINEMTDGGYGFHDIFQNLPKWIEKLDIEAIKKDAGLIPRESNTQAP